MKKPIAKGLTLTIQFLILTAQSNAEEFIWLEAEEGAISSPMTIGVDPEASGGLYIYSETAEQGTGTYAFTVEGGDYMIWALAAAAEPSGSGGHNSFHVSLDFGPEDVWDLFEDAPGGSPYTTWTYDPISLRCGGNSNSHGCDPWLISLPDGQHTVTFRSRESLTRLDRILITSDLSFNPADPPTPITGSVTIGWDSPTTNKDGSPLTDLGGVRLHYGTASRQYDTTIDLGLQTLVTVTNLVPLKPYYFAVTAYNQSGDESDYSAELAWAYDDTDLDSISDTWEISFFGSIDSTTGAVQADSDVDGLSTLDEYIVGTDPTNATSSYVMAYIGVSGNGFTVSADVLPAEGPEYAGLGRHAGLEVCQDLIEGSWTTSPHEPLLITAGHPPSFTVDPQSGVGFRMRIWLQ